jgi:hypothetical protein
MRIVLIVPAVVRHPELTTYACRVCGDIVTGADHEGCRGAACQGCLPELRIKDSAAFRFGDGCHAGRAIATWVPPFALLLPRSGFTQAGAKTGRRFGARRVEGSW